MEDIYDSQARFQSSSGRFLTIDPLAEKYYSISPYAYCAGNPVRYIDPDGEKLKIWYKDQQGRDQIYIYSGGAVTIDNKFVDQVAEAYHYNKENCRGDNPMTTATEGNLEIPIIQTDGENMYWSSTVYWNPELGLQTETTVLSPATSVDHEMDHALDDAQSHNEHSKNVSTFDSQYGTKEERRVITGSEQKTARANGEKNDNLPTRVNHGGKSVIVKHGVTSTKIDYVKTQEYENRRRKIKNDSTIQWPE